MGALQGHSLCNKKKRGSKWGGGGFQHRKALGKWLWIKKQVTVHRVSRQRKQHGEEQMPRTNHLTRCWGKHWKINRGRDKRRGILCKFVRCKWPTCGGGKGEGREKKNLNEKRLSHRLHMAGARNRDPNFSRVRLSTRVGA